MKWKQRLESAHRMGGLDSRSQAESQSWMTCAVGESLNLGAVDDISYMLGSFLEKVYPQVYTLGIEFTNRCDENEDPDAIEAVYNKILDVCKDVEKSNLEREYEIFCKGYYARGL